jgi:hypothetical protein
MRKLILLVLLASAAPAAPQAAKPDPATPAAVVSPQIRRIALSGRLGVGREMLPNLYWPNMDKFNYIFHTSGGVNPEWLPDLMLTSIKVS